MSDKFVRGMDLGAYMQRVLCEHHHMDQTPSVGRIVHYVSYGTPGGEYTSQCRAAIITEVNGYSAPEHADDHMHAECHLAILNPTGMFFNQVSYGPQNVPGTWHWPERA